MQYKEYTDNDIAIQFEGTTDDGTAPDESLIGKPLKKDLKKKKKSTTYTEKIRRKEKTKK